MGLEIAIEALKSRKVRQAIVGEKGLRQLALNASSDKKDGEGNFLESVYNSVERFGQSLMEGTIKLLGNALSFSWTKFWSYCVSNFNFVWNFNWNATDKELDEQIKQGEIALAAARGGLRGKALGYLVCGLVPTATIAVFNEPMALYVLKELGEEAAEEIAQSLANLLTLQVRQWTRQTFISLFKNHRQFLRGWFLGYAGILANLNIGFSKEAVEKANKNRNEPWSFASAHEDTLDEIKDPIAKADAEEFYEEFGEACIEAGYIVAGGVDAYLAQQKIANDNLLGEEKIVEITFNRSADNNTDTQ